ncbi:hypothetical protein CLU79DRAFT_884748 [Phycomyces nitens]|nr:hypothetical protein CLU79DRAFT_884748 [Phycomyces nitens]
MFGQTFSAQSSSTISTRPVIPCKRSRSDSLIEPSNYPVVTTGDFDMDYEYDDHHADDDDEDDIEIILDPLDLDIQDQFIFEISRHAKDTTPNGSAHSMKGLSKASHISPNLNPLIYLRPLPNRNLETGTPPELSQDPRHHSYDPVGLNLVSRAKKRRSCDCIWGMTIGMMLTDYEPSRHLRVFVTIPHRHLKDWLAV